MGSIRKIGDAYYIEFCARGLVYQQKAGANRHAARSLLKDIEEKIRKGEMDAIVRDVDVDIFLHSFLERARGEQPPKTFTRYRLTADHFKEFCRMSLPSGSKLSAVTPRVIEDYRVLLIKKASRLTSCRCVNFTLYLLRDILDYAIKLGYLNDNPTLHVRMFETAGRKKPVVLSDAQAARLLENVSRPLDAVIRTAVGTGLRIEEIVRLKWTEVDFSGNCLTIGQSFERPEGPLALSRTVAMDAAVEKGLADIYKKRTSDDGYVFIDARGRPMSRLRIARDFRNAVKIAGLPDFQNFSILQHTFVYNVLRKGVSLVGLGRLLGLDDVAKAMRYEGFYLDVNRQKIAAERNKKGH